MTIKDLIRELSKYDENFSVLIKFPYYVGSSQADGFLDRIDEHRGIKEVLCIDDSIVLIDEEPDN
jgi:hypothetical protein